MNGLPTDDTTAALLADAMRAEVATTAPPAGLVTGLAPRAARRRRARLAAVGGVACAALVAVALSVGATTADPAPPAGLPPTPAPAATPSTTESPEPAFRPPPRMEAATLPPGFRYWNTEHPSTNPSDSDVWPLMVIYARGFTDAGRPRTPIRVITASQSIDEVGPEDFRDPKARWVVVGRRRVLRTVDATGTVGYHWTERRHVNVSVTGGPGVSDDELRHVVAAVRLVTPARADSLSLDGYDRTGVLLRETRGRGSRTIGPIAVPAAFDVHIVCLGKQVRVEIGTLRELGLGCGGTPLRNIVDRTNGIRSVTITLTADSATRWALLVTTSAGRP